MFKMFTLVHKGKILDFNLKIKLNLKFQKIFCSRGQGRFFMHFKIWSYF